MVPLALWMMLGPTESINPLPAVLPSHSSMPDSNWAPAHDVSCVTVVQSLNQRHVVGPAEAFLNPNVLPELKRDGDKLRKKHRLAADWAAVNGELSIRDPDFVRDDPMRRGQSWATDETVRVPLSDAVFVFGSLDAADDSVEQRQLRYLTKTGFGVKLRPWLLDEVQLRGGPAKRYDETDGTDRSEIFVEVTTKVDLPFLGSINVEYSGFAFSAVTAAERDRLNQNLKFILPISGGSSEFQFGARWWSTDDPHALPIADRTSLFLGLQLRR